MKHKLTREDLLAIIVCIQKTLFVDSKCSKDLIEIKQLACGTVCILLELYFGEYNSELIWLYAIGSDKNKFSTFNELYDYLSDPNSELVSDVASSLDELLENHSENKMFLDFKKCVDEIPS